MDMALLLEAEKRGILPEDKKPLLAEARRRGLIGGGEKQEAPNKQQTAAQPQDNMSGLEKFGVGVGYGMKQAGQGALQAVLEGGEYIRKKLGMKSNKANVDKLQGVIDRDRAAFAPLANESMAATGGEIVGGMIPAFVLPGGAAKGLASRMATAAGQGAVIGGLQPTSGSESRGKNTLIGATTGAGVTGAMAAVKPVAKAFGRTAKESLGMTTGAGKGAVDEALQGGDSFKKALRGQISGEEVVGTAKTALNAIKDKRLSDYQRHLANISGVNNPGAVAADIDITPIAKKLGDQLNNYNIKTSINPQTGRLVFDTSRVAMGQKGIRDIKGVIQELQQWGSKPGDQTAVGLDTLKRRLDDFYSDSSQARQFVASMKKIVADTIKKSVPEYGEMTKGYAEATSLIKDIESGLMMKKQGMSGRVTADQTLRRLTSAMRENFEMRKDLVDALGAQGGKDVAGQVAGYAMNQVVPRGLVAKLGGFGVGGAAYLHLLSPQFLPVLAASSPRIVGEFLMAFGKAHGAVSKAASAIPKKAITVGKNMVTKAATAAATQPETSTMTVGEVKKWKEIGDE